jgi:hypothetical protein
MYVYIYICIYIYMSPVKIQTLEPDPSQCDSPAACVITQQYSSVSLHFYSCQEKIWHFSKNVVFNLLYILKIVKV